VISIRRQATGLPAREEVDMSTYVPIPKPTWFVMVITPLDKDNRIHEAAFRAHLRRMAAAGLGVYVGSGGSGEGHALTPDEYEQVCAIAVDECSGKIPVYTNPHETRTARDMVELMQRCAKTGVDVVQAYQLDPGHGRRPSLEEQDAYYRYILERVDHPTAISIHSGSGYIAPPEFVSKLCEDYPQVKIINLATGSDMRYFISLKDMVSPEIRLFGGHADALGALALGGWGVQDTVANVAPRLCASIVTYFLAGDNKRAGEAYAQSLRLMAPVWGTRWGGPPMIKGVLAAMGLLPEEGSFVREPYLRPDAAAVAKAVAGVEDLKIEELPS
jgi:4-hydroxy-tetrahydrodipicolinate synthase